MFGMSSMLPSAAMIILIISAVNITADLYNLADSIAEKADEIGLNQPKLRDILRLVCPFKYFISQGTKLSSCMINLSPCHTLKFSNSYICAT